MNHRKPNLSWIRHFILSLNWIYILSCTTEYTGSNGILSSANFSSHNGAKWVAYCRSTINLHHNQRIHIKWQSFDFPGKMPYCDDSRGYLRLTRCSPAKYLIRYCGDILPHDFISYENCIRIDYYSDYPGAERFQLQYETLDVLKPINPSVSEFTIHETHNSMNIYTPNWPLTYSGMVPSNGIRHRVTFNRMMDMKILFMGIDLYAPQKSTRLCEDARNDVLKLEIVLTNGGSYSFKYCGQQQPFSRTYSNHFKYIDFVFNPGNTISHNHKGFALGISFFERSNDLNYIAKEKEGMNPNLKVAIVIPILAVLFFLCYMKGKARQRGGVRAWFHTVQAERTADHAIQPPRSIGEPPPYTLPVSAPPLYPPPSYTIPLSEKSQGSIETTCTIPYSGPSQQTPNDTTGNIAPSYPPPPRYEDAFYSQPGQVTSVHNIGS